MKRTILFVAIFAALAGCSDRQPQVVYQQPAPVVYQQPQQPVVVQQHDNSGAALVTGMAVGAMISNANNNRDRDYREPSHTTINKTVYVNQAPVPVQTPTTTNRFVPPAPIAVAPTPVTRPGQSLYIPPVRQAVAPTPAPNFTPRNVVTPTMAPARPMVVSTPAPAPRPTVSYAPSRPTTTTTVRSTSSFSTSKSTSSSFKR